jgi:outer membrane lipase/esterase
MNSIRSRALAALVLLGSALTAAAQSAPALRSYNSYFFFGDSLTDSGNTFALTGSPPPPYFNGRVSNGITFAEYLRSGLAAHATAPGTVRTNLNFAFAGATAAPGSAVPNLTQQIGLYQSRGITANANDVYVILAGANDLLNAVQNPALQNAPGMTATGVAASTAVTNAVQTLAGLGAKNILVLNLPDISRTPRFTTGSGAQGAIFVQNGVMAFNNDLRTRLAGVNVGADVRVTVFDLQSVFNALLTNPGVFGFSITNQEYLGILQGGGNPGDVNNYIFWDGIHPTTRAHAVFANALLEVLNPEFVLGTAAVQGTALLTAIDMAADAVADRLALTRYGGMRHPADGWVSYGFKDGSRDWAGYQGEFDYTARVFAAGFDMKISESLLAGVAVTADSIESKLKAGAGSSKLEGQLVHAYAQWRTGRFFVEGAGSYGTHDVRSISRATMLGGLATAGETEGDRWGASLKLGADFGFEGLHVTPFVGLRYAKATLDGYAETGVNGLNFSYDRQNVKSVDGLIGAAADWHLKAGEMPLVVSLSATFQTDLAGDTRDVTGRLANTLAATNRIAVTDGLEDSLKLGVRVNGAFSKRWGWSAGYMAEIRDDGDTASQYSFSIHTGF